MTATFKHPVDKQEAQRILASSYDRALFVQEYKYFGKDSNDRLYRTFILDTIHGSNNVDLVSDVLYLAIEINFFSKQLLNEVVKISFSRKHYLIKLACLDYLTHFKHKITNRDFYTYNERIYKTSRNSLMKVQALTNLFKISPIYFERLLDILKKEDAPAAFYRSLRGFVVNKIKLSRDQTSLLKQVINHSNFRAEVARELLSRVKKMS